MRPAPYPSLRRLILTLIACGLASGPVSLAINLNEASGSPTNATLLEGLGGDSISAYSGDLGLSVSIGPRWELPGMSWGLSLNYSSKIWRLGTGLNVDRELERRGAFGIGCRLTMGRVFQMCRYTCTGLNNLHYEDPSGTLHPIYLDVPVGVPNILNGHTSDGRHDHAREGRHRDGTPNLAEGVRGLRVYVKRSTWSVR